ncbi:MAG: 30S ribosomal protein S6e, partial [Thermoplasmata archaeon]
DTKAGRSHNKTVKGHYAGALIGKKIGDEVDGIFFDLPGYKLLLTGGSDKDGFPMRPDLPGHRRKRILVAGGVGFRSNRSGLRRRKTLRGNTVGPDTVQLNLKIVAYGPKSIEDAFKEKVATE